MIQTIVSNFLKIFMGSQGCPFEPFVSLKESISLVPIHNTKV